MNTNGSQPAYPINELHGSAGDYVMQSDGGLTKREAFAMAAMQGLITGTDGYSVPQLKEMIGVEGEWVWAAHWPQAVARMSAAHADALLAELAKEPS